MEGVGTKEREAKMSEFPRNTRSPSGALDTSRGIRQFTGATGDVDHGGIGTTKASS
jgi:hypothetical protein